jgi:hypothetical protein
VKIKCFLAWYDFWIGWFWSQKSRTLYICPLPMVCISLIFTQPAKPESTYDYRVVTNPQPVTTSPLDTGSVRISIYRSLLPLKKEP